MTKYQASAADAVLEGARSASNGLQLKKVFQRDPEAVKECIQLYADNPLFGATEEWTTEDDPYRRAVRPHVLKYIDFTKTLARREALNYSALAAQRLLLNIYESDLVFLPEKGFASKRKDFELFYSQETKLLGELARPILEDHVFSFLDKEVSVSGKWTPAILKSYLDDLVREANQSESRSVAAILSSPDRERTASSFLIQLMMDFLSEASAMIRNVGGRFGPIQSELFKVIVDEYGYGVHDTKHSTLFERTLESCGLEAQTHAYFQFYLTSSMALSNYFHYVSRDHSKFFRFLGALAYTEATFSHTCRQISEALRTVFGAKADTRYFDEHVHIDLHHGRMVFDKIVVPALEKHGDIIIEDIVRGIEEFRLLSEIAESDFVEQSDWSDRGLEYKGLTEPLLERITSGAVRCRQGTYVEPLGELSITHVHDADELCLVESGVMDFVTGHDRKVPLHPGEGTILLHNRLHGALITSKEDCVYHIYSIDDYKACLS